MADKSILFGFPEEWEDFRNRNGNFLELFPHLQAAVELAFTRDFVAPEIIDLFIMMYGRLCFEDFH